jgi:hypothetical protein
MSLSTIIGISGHALLLTAIVMRLAYALKLRKSHGYILAAVLLLITLIPIDDLSAAHITRGIFGDLSVTSLILLLRFIILPQASTEKSRELFFLVVIAGIMFYPAALGLGMLDPYQWGYLNSYRGVEVPIVFLSILVGLLLIAVAKNNTLITLCITMALAAFTLQALESRNIWDYLIDPLVVTFGLVSLGIHYIKQISGKLSAN